MLFSILSPFASLPKNASVRLSARLVPDVVLGPRHPFVCLPSRPPRTGGNFVRLGACSSRLSPFPVTSSQRHVARRNRVQRGPGAGPISESGKVYTLSSTFSQMIVTV